MPPKIIDVKHLGERRGGAEENVTGTSVAGAIAMVAMARCWRIERFRHSPDCTEESA